MAFQRGGEVICSVRTIPAIAVFATSLPFASAATQDGALRMEVITAYNLVVDSNIETPAGKSPSAAHMGVKITNTGAVPLTNVVVNIGNMTSPGVGTPGVFASRTVDEVGQYAGTFQLAMPSGPADAVRVIPTIAAGETVVQYFFVTYPLLDGPVGTGRSVTGAASVPEDDLWLNYDIWASANSGALQVDQRTKVTMRNEISAMANKIWPNGSNKVPEEYLSAIQATVGWRPEAGVTRIPGAVVMEGIWYDLGNVGAGFDNNGDGIPDRNAWMQPVGDPTKFSSLAARMVKCYGLVIVKLNDGTEQLIPFEDQLYFENIPANNTGVVGLVFYEFIPLDLTRPALLSPYQEVASGYDNEKFNSDYGASVGSVSGTPPIVAFDKDGPVSIAGGATATYTLSAANNELAGSSKVFGWPELSLPLVFQDTIPSSLVYVAGSATSANSPPSGQTYTVYWSTNNGASWVTTEPTPSTVTTIRWILSGSLAAGQSTAVSFDATLPLNYIGAAVDNTACLKTGTETNFACDTTTTIITGINSLGDFIWRDLDRDGNQDGGLETGISGIGVSLYIDADGDELLDPDEPLYATTTTDTNGAYLFTNLPDRKYIVVVNAADAVPYSYTLKGGVSDRFAIDLDSAGASATAVADFTADWPFIQALEVTKTVTPSTYFAGDLITYDVHLDNHMATLQLPVPNVQTAYANPTAFHASQASAKASEAQAAGAPNNVFTYIDWTNNSDSLQSTGISPSFTDVGAAITKVELIIRGYMSIPLANDTLDIYIRNAAGTWLNNEGAAFTTLSTAQLNALVGVSQDLVIDVTNYVPSPGTWTWAQVGQLRTRLSAAKVGGGDAGDYYIDSIGFRVTSANTPYVGSSGPNTISQWPIIDTYDPTELEFVTASVTPDVTTPLGTLAWHNLGPVHAGARKSITVTFRAKHPTDTTIPADGRVDPMTVTNTVDTDGAMDGHIPLFQSGLPAGHDDSSVDVTINPAGRIGDFVYWDIDANSIYDNGDTPLRRVIVQLYRLNGAVYEYTGQSQFTDINGYYEFTGLADGTYQIRVTTDTASELFSLPWTTFTSYQKGTAGTNQTGYVQGDSVVINTTDFVTSNDTNFLQDFGFDSNAASLISGNLFRDWNGNGIQDPGDEPLVGYTITMSGGASASTTTDSNGFYLFSNITTTGNHTITVTAPPANHIQTLDFDATFDHATTVNVALGNFYKARNFAYRPSGALSIGDTLYYDWNGNGTQDLGEGGISNISIHLHEDANGDGIVNSTDGLVGIIVTDANGFYEFTGLVAGNYIVMVDEGDPDFPANHIQTQDYDGLADDKAQVNLVTSLDTVDFGYLPTGTSSIGNLVWLDADNDGIKDASESGISGVTVQLYLASQTPGVDTPAAVTTTSVDGSYLFENLSSAGYYVYLPASNFDPGQPFDLYHWSSVNTSNSDNQVDNDDNGIQTTHGDPVTSPLITLSLAESDQTIDFGFTGSGAIGDFVFYDSNGNGSQDYSETGIPGVTVKLFLDANADGIADSPTPVRTTITSDGTDGNSVGSYRFGHLITGTYFVQVDITTLPAGVTYTADPDRDGVPVGALPALPVGDHADSLVIVTSESNYSGADFGYKPPGAIGDFVWLDLDQDGVQDSGEPGIAGVTVQITNGTTTYNVTTDFDGYWSQIVANDNWTVSIPASNFSGGGALENLAATYDADAGTLDTVAITVAAGLVNLPVGNLGIDFGYKLNGNYGLSGTIAIHDTGLPGTADDVDDFNDDGVDMDAGPLDEVELSGVEVFLFTSGGDFLGSTFTDAEGDYAFTGLASGSYKVIIGTTAAPLDYSTLTTTSGNNLSGSTVTNTATSVTQLLTIVASSVVNVDFTFNSTVDYDFGDLPSSYSSTTLAQDGARHIIPSSGPTLRLGATRDADTNGLVSALANGDDIFGVDDEDGVTPVAISTWTNGTVGSGNGGDIQVVVTGSGWLVGWIDWNHDGDLLDSGEFVVSQAVSTGTSAISFDIPASTIGASSESWLARFRVFTTKPAFPLFSYEGSATNGEVEDHLFEKPVAGSIGDFVWSDLDGDGVKDSGEEGIGGITVQAYDGVTTLTQTTGTGLNDVDGDGVIDPVGYYRFRGLAAATYTVTVTTPPTGYLPSYDENGTVTPHVTSVNLAADVQHLTADFGYQPLRASISGQVRFDVDADGNLADPDPGGPSVTIQLWTDPNGDGNPSDGIQVGETTTDNDGNYIFANVPTGNYVVVEINPIGATSTADVDGGNFDRITVAMVGVNITGRDFLDTVPASFYGSIAGTVLADIDNDDDGDDPIAGVTVRLFQGVTLIATTTTNVSGDYLFSNVLPGSYTVVETQPAGYASVDDVDGGNLDINGDVTPISVSAGEDVEDQDFIEEEYGSIAGSVLADIDNDNDGDDPIAGVTVRLFQGVTLIATTTTNVSGDYLFSNVLPGSYTVVETQPAGYASVGDVDGGNLDINGDVTPISVDAGEDVVDQDFIEEEYGSIAGSVLADIDNDDDGDDPIAGVTVRLFQGVTLIATTTTNGSGDYLFSNVLPGSYTVVETQPAGYGSVGDVDGGNLNINGDVTPISVDAGEDVVDQDFIEEEYGSISGYVLEGANPIENVVITLLDENGANIDSDLLTGGVQPTTTLTDVNGYYEFTDLPPGTYQVRETQPFGYESVGDADGGDPNLIGDVAKIELSAGEDSVNNNFIETVDTCPDDWTEWKAQHPTQTPNGNPGGNPDLDNYDNFSEFAFAMPYDSGVPSKWLDGTAWIIQPSTINPNTLEGVFVRPTGAPDNVIYKLQYTSSLTPTNWQELVIPSMQVAISTVNNGDCTETVTIHNLETITGLTTGEGFVRIKAILDDDGGNNEEDHISFTEVEGWTETEFGMCCQSYNVPYLREALFTGTVAAVNGQDVSFTGADLDSFLTPSVAYYIEVTSGDNEGHRFDVVSAADNTITLALDSNPIDLHAATPPFNTLSGAPPLDLQGDTIILRRHWTLDEIFPPSAFGATGLDYTADQVQVFSGNSWQIYWLYDENGANPPTARWVDVADSNNDDKGGVVIPPGQGMFFNNRTAATSLLAYGEVRTNDFIRPLRNAFNLVGGGYPINQSANGEISEPYAVGKAPGRNMNKPIGFFGSTDFKTADSIFIWKPDANPSAQGYDTYYLLDGAPRNPSLLRWVKFGSSNNVIFDSDSLLLRNRAAQIRSKNLLNGHTHPSPWTP